MKCLILTKLEIVHSGKIKNNYLQYEILYVFEDILERFSKKFYKKNKEKISWALRKDNE